MTVNKNTNFNIEQITDILAELESGKIIISELIENFDQYEELIESTRSELSNIGSVTDEVREKIDKNVKFLMDQIDNIMNSTILLRKTSVKKIDLLIKLWKGIRYSYKFNNNVHVINP